MLFLWILAFRYPIGIEAAGYKSLKPFIDQDSQNSKSSQSGHPVTLTKKTEEHLIIVNDLDEEINFLPRSQCHAGDGVLQRAFSVHIFNDRNQILLQQRSKHKVLWPLHWSNSCCSHPRVGETPLEAAQRRLQEELGFSAPLRYLYNFKYQARYSDVGSENEMCSVFIGKGDGPVNIDKYEIAAVRFVDFRALELELRDHPERFTPWFKMQWYQLRRRLDFDATDLRV